MIKLSDRLQLIADLIEVGQTVADIGTDHGFLPIFLRESNKSPKVILADISKGSLQKAIDNVNLRGYNSVESGFEFRLGNGIQVLDDGEVNAVVIAGMGGVLMTEILGFNLKKSLSFDQIILQPRNGQGKLRWCLQNNGFNIKNEKLIREGKFICEIIVIEPLKTPANHKNSGECAKIDMENEAENIEYEFPESILISNGALGVEFARKKLVIENGILSNLRKALSNMDEKIVKQEQRVKYLEKLIKKYANA
ncbi:MAG: tRNA (adenine(22)-N(1))-methyltransferase [Aminipila sp.]